jgi:hypothetical protein
LVFDTRGMMETPSIFTKKLPEWVSIVVGSIVSAIVIASGAWAWNINATLSSNKAEMEFVNTKSNETKSDVNDAIKAIGKRLDDMEEKFDHRFERIENKIDKLNFKKGHTDFLAKE